VKWIPVFTGDFDLFPATVVINIDPGINLNLSSLTDISQGAARLCQGRCAKSSHALAYKTFLCHR
jgi:hypothetical protein